MRNKHGQYYKLQYKSIKQSHNDKIKKKAILRWSDINDNDLFEYIENGEQWVLHKGIDDFYLKNGLGYKRKLQLSLLNKKYKRLNLG